MAMTSARVGLVNPMGVCAVGTVGRDGSRLTGCLEGGLGSASRFFLARGLRRGLGPAGGFGLAVNLSGRCFEGIGASDSQGYWCWGM